MFQVKYRVSNAIYSSQAEDVVLSANTGLDPAFSNYPGCGPVANGAAPVGLAGQYFDLAQART